MIQTYRDSGKTSKEFAEMAKRAKEAAHQELKEAKETPEGDNVKPTGAQSVPVTEQLQPNQHIPADKPTAQDKN